MNSTFKTRFSGYEKTLVEECEKEACSRNRLNGVNFAQKLWKIFNFDKKKALDIRACSV